MVRSEVVNLKSMTSCENFTKWQYDQIKSFINGRVLEIGCGLGNLTPYFFNSNYQGVDIDSNHVKYCTEKFGPRFFLLDVGKEALVTSVDTIVMVNVLEHVENDWRALRNCNFMLDKGGLLVLIVPAYQFLFNEVDRADGHYRRYNKKELKQKLEQAGFKVIHSKYFNMTAILGWLSDKVFKRAEHKRKDLKTFNKIVPIIRTVEDNIPNPIGLSIVMVGKKE